MAVPRTILGKILQRSLAEDIGHGDVTVQLIPQSLKALAFIKAKEYGVIAGLEEAKILFESLNLNATPLVKDGVAVKTGRKVMQVEGRAADILMAERTALNLIGRMSGIATETRRLVSMAEKKGVTIAATRKTAIGLRHFDKKAVKLGGGDPHRFGLDDMILLKTNHILALGGMEKAVKLAREKGSFTKKIEVEATNLEDALKAARLGVDIVMLDNMTAEKARIAVKALRKVGLRGKGRVELSGGITNRNLLQYLEAKPDIISLGYITESPLHLDLNLNLARLVKR